MSDHHSTDFEPVPRRNVDRPLPAPAMVRPPAPGAAQRKTSDYTPVDQGVPAPIHTLVLQLPAACAPYADDVRRFVDAMLYKLAKNAHKGKWEGMDAETAVQYLNKEREELREALEGRNVVEVLLEAADVANFALIVSALAMDGKYNAR